MAYILFSSSGYLERLGGEIRLSIFLTAGLCGGLPALVWALRVLYGHYKSGGRISALVIILLLSDLLELLLSPYVVTKLLQDDDCWDSSWTCQIITSVWSASVIYGLQLQQVVALEAALSFRQPPSSDMVLLSCFITISIIVFIFFFLCEIFKATLPVLLSLPVLLLITLTSWIITCRAPPQTSHAAYRTRGPSSTVLAFVTSTLLNGMFTSVSAVMYIVPAWGNRYAWDVFVMGVSLMSLNVIIDPLLCVLVCRRPTDLNKSEVNISRPPNNHSSPAASVFNVSSVSLHPSVLPAQC